MSKIANVVLGFTITLQNGRKFSIYDRTLLQDLRYYDEKGVDTTVTGIVDSIGARFVKGEPPKDPHCHPCYDPHKNKTLGANNIDVEYIVLDCSQVYRKDIRKIPLNRIVSIGKVLNPGYEESDIIVGQGECYKSIQDVIDGSPAGTTIRLLDGIYDEPLNITKAITITSAPNSQATLTGSINVKLDDLAEGDGKVFLKNMTLTGDAKIVVEKAATFVMDNIDFAEHKLFSKTMPISIPYDGKMLLVITDCDFGPQNEHSYNLIDCYAKLVNGSSISRNNFEDGCCVHNQISLYGIDDKALVGVNYNYAAYSSNLLRIGFKGKPVGVVNVIENRYDFTDTDNRYQGVLVVQPYGTETESFAGVKINIKTGAYPSGTRVAYCYAGENDTPFTDDNKPTVYVNDDDYELIDTSKLDEDSPEDSEPDPGTVPGGHPSTIANR